MNDEDTSEYDDVGSAPNREPSMGKRPDTEKLKNTVGRKRYRAISKSVVSAKLYNGSKRHIDTMVREFRNSDPAFSSVGAAIRHYVHVGISAEAASTDLRWTLDYSPIKKAQKDAVREELKPHSGNIKNLEKKIEEMMLETGQLFRDITTRTDNIEAKLDVGFENTAERLEKILLTGDHSFRNIAVLRSLFYVFLLGIQTNLLNTGKENLAQWKAVVRTAHEKVGEFAAEELRLLTADQMENDFIRKLTLDIFSTVKDTTILREEPTRILRTPR